MVFIKKQHYYEIDVFKGIAILLIILGHCFCSYPVDFSTTGLHYFQEYILSFHLNIFFVASGLLFSVGQDWVTFLHKKTQRLLLPWLTFSILSILLRVVFSSITHGHIDNFFETFLMNIVCGNYFWFLYALFIMMALTKIICQKNVLMTVGFLLFLLQLLMVTYNYAIRPNILCLSRVIHFYPWFIIGYLLKEYYSSLTAFVENNKLGCTIYSFTSLVLMLFFVLLGGTLVEYIVLPFLGVTSLYIIAVLITITKNNIINRIFIFFGKYSLQYYLNHLLVMLGCYYVGSYFFSISPVVSLLVIFLTAMLVSTMILWTERKMPSPINYLFGFI